MASFKSLYEVTEMQVVTHINKQLLAARMRTFDAIVSTKLEEKCNQLLSDAHAHNDVKG